ncbi:MAG: methyl-accepting chemotaxis protein, partial [Brevinema sp.]
NFVLLFLWRYLEFYLPSGFMHVLLENQKVLASINGVSLSFPIILLSLGIAHLLQIFSFLYYMYPINKLFLFPETRSVFSGNHLTYGFHFMFWAPLIALLVSYNHYIPPSQLVPHFSKIQLIILQNLFITTLWYISSKIFEISNSMVFRYFQTHRFCTYETSKIYHNKIISSAFLFGIMMVVLTLHIHPFIRFYTQNNYPPYDLLTHLPKILTVIAVMIFYSFFMTLSLSRIERQHIELFEEYLHQMNLSQYADFTYNVSKHNDKITEHFNKYLNKINDSWLNTYKISKSLDLSLKDIKKTAYSIKPLPKFDESSDAFNGLTKLSQYISKVISTFQTSREKLNDDFKDIMELPNNIYDTIQIAYEIKCQCSLCLSNATIIMNKIENTMKKSQSITDSMHKISQNIKSAGIEAEFIDEILLLLQDIAEQTNILSINAALEAAHAGNAGKGFAIVSNEVRALATASSDAVDDISQKLISIQNFIKIAVNQVSDLERITDENHLLITESFEIMNRVLTNFKNIELVATKTCSSTDIQGKMTEQTFIHITNFLYFLETYQELLKKQQNDIQLLREKTTVISLFEKETARNIDHLVTAIQNLESIKKEITTNLTDITQVNPETLIKEPSLSMMD